ncbi:hypothetical protein ACS0TY_000840 [Phlomoides rotata]
MIVGSGWVVFHDSTWPWIVIGEPPSLGAEKTRSILTLIIVTCLNIKVYLLTPENVVAQTAIIWVVHVGDHCQISPVIMCKKAAGAGLAQSLFKLLVMRTVLWDCCLHASSSGWNFWCYVIFMTKSIDSVWNNTSFVRMLRAMKLLPLVGVFCQKSYKSICLIQGPPGTCKMATCAVLIEESTQENEPGCPIQLVLAVTQVLKFSPTALAFLSVYGAPKLNASQVFVFNSVHLELVFAVQSVLRKPLSLFQGPRGTRKTVTTTAIVYHMAKYGQEQYLKFSPTAREDKMTIITNMAEVKASHYSIILECQMS